MRPIVVVTSEEADFLIKTQHPIREAVYAKNICDKCIQLEATPAEPVKCIKTVSLTAMSVFFYYGQLKLGIDVSFWMLFKNNGVKVKRVGIDDVFESFNKEYELIETFYDSEKDELNEVSEKAVSGEYELSVKNQEVYPIHKFDDLWTMGVCIDLERSFSKPK